VLSVELEPVIGGEGKLKAVLEGHAGASLVGSSRRCSAGLLVGCLSIILLYDARCFSGQSLLRKRRGRYVGGMASSRALVDNHLRPQASTTRESKAGPEPNSSGMSSTTVGPGDDASASLPELAAAEASEPDEGLGFFTVFGFLDEGWPLPSSAEPGCAPPPPGF
jgi:hypothetical protein